MKNKKIKTVFIIAIMLIMSYSLSGNDNEIQTNDNEPKTSTVSMDISKVGTFTHAEINDGGWWMDAWMTGVHVLGNYAYVVSDTLDDDIDDYNHGLEIIDISNPTNPIKVGHFNDGGYVRDVYVLGDYAYVAKCYDGFMIINITDPSNPIKVGQYDDYYVFNTDIVSIYVVGNYAYILDYWYGGLEIIDISNPIGPCKVGEFMNGIYDDINMQSIYVDGNYAYIACEDDGLYILDISDPTNPTEVGQYYDDGYAFDVYVSGSYAYIANIDIGLEIIDISDPTTPVKVGQYDTEDTHDVYVDGNYAYISGGIVKEGFVGLIVIDISDPTTPKRVGFYSKYWEWGWINDIFVVGSYVYLACPWEGLQILYVSEVENTISVIMPNNSERWQNGSSHQIYWNFTGYIPLVNIELYKEGIFEMIIGLNASLVSVYYDEGEYMTTPLSSYYTYPFEGIFNWDIPSDIINSSYYQIKIIDASDSSVYDYSEYFEISDMQNDDDDPIDDNDDPIDDNNEPIVEEEYNDPFWYFFSAGWIIVIGFIGIAVIKVKLKKK